MSDFELEKWYMDAHDEEGRALIAYSARLRWKSLTLFYNGYTYASASPQSSIVKRNSFSVKNLPLENGGSVLWKHFKIDAHWQQKDQSFGERLLEHPQGDIDWQCIFPEAAASVKIADESFGETSVGYVEKIRMTILPWEIPIRELYWGRFLSPGHTLVWIRWKGAIPKTLLYHNGKRTEEVTISTEFIIFDNYSLALTNKRTLRKGTVLSTVFAKFPAIAKLFPGTITQLQENKWISDGILSVNSKSISNGRAIHEHVLW